MNPAPLNVVPTVLLDAPLPARIVVGRGTMLPVTGRLISHSGRIRRATCLLDGTPVPSTFGVKREDAFGRHGETFDRPDSLRHSGFKALLTFRPHDVEPRCPRELTLRTTTADGTTTDIPLGRFALVASAGETRNSWPDFPSSGARVAICMATYNPPRRLFARQIESIRRQTHTNWICLITDDSSSPEAAAVIKEVLGDDSRFLVVRNETRLGFYRNFERCLSLAPPHADFVALSDQDDAWRPDKLSLLLSAFQESTTLVYSDMRIVEETGEEIAPTFWTQRPNRWDNLASMIVANAVTGAASMFRPELLDRILPFPHSAGPASERQFHDHWIACVALACGQIEFVDRPLYDYVQHGDNVIGHRQEPGKPGSGPAARRSFRTRLWNKLKAPLPWLEWAHGYHAKCLGIAELIQHVAACLDLRCGSLTDRRKQRQVEWLRRIDHSRLAQAYLMLRGIRNFWTTTETLQRDLHVGIALATQPLVAAAESLARAYRAFRQDRKTHSATVETRRDAEDDVRCEHAGTVGNAA